MDCPSSHGVSVSRGTRCKSTAPLFAYGAFTLSDGPFQNLRLSTAGLTLTGCSAFARHYSRNDLFSSGYLDVSVRPVPLHLVMCSPGHAQACPCAGFPIRTPPVRAGAHPSPELFAVYRVLHRHVTPRHSPYALVALPCVAEKSSLSRYIHVCLTSSRTSNATLLSASVCTC